MLQTRSMTPIHSTLTPPPLSPVVPLADANPLIAAMNRATDVSEWADGAAIANLLRKAAETFTAKHPCQHQ